MLTRSILAVLCLAAVGCGTDEPDAADATPTATPAATPTPGDEAQRLLPMSIGASWTYRVTDLATLEVTEKTRAIDAFEDIGGRKTGIAGWRLRVENANGHSLSWFEDLGEHAGVVRHREQSYDAAGVLEKDEFYDASKLRVDESDAHRVTGATWSETYLETIVETGLPDVSEEEVRNWTVVAALEPITVPAGTFDALRVRRTSPGGGTDKTSWFVEGIGAVKEYEAGVDDVELTAWSLPEAE